MKKNLFRRWVISFVLMSGLIAFISCNDKDTNIGLNLMPDSDKISLFADTIGVDCYTVNDDIVSTDERTLSPLGSYFDPIFGFTKAEFVCHTRISSSNVDFSAVQEINSLELQLKYSSYYGDPSAAQTVKVYRLKKEVYYDSVYYSNFTLNESQYEWLASVPLEFNASDSLLKIQLPIALAESFKDPLNKKHFVDNTTFIKFFNGLYVTTEDVASGGCIYSLNLLHANSKMVMHYNDSLKYDFLINNKSAIINMFEHDYGTASAEVQAAVADTTILRNLCFVQSLGGVKTKIKFPKLENYFDSTNIAINKAQLVITVKTVTDENIFAPPPKMTLVAITQSGKYDFITDYKLNNSYFGGTLKPGEYTYKFNIPFHIQELINGNEDYGIYLFAADNRTIPYRAVIHANDNSEKSMRLEIYYSKY